MSRKIKRILALGAVVIILLLYLATFVLAFSKDERAGDLLMAALVATVVLPVLLYIYLWLAKTFRRKDDEEE